MGLVISVEDWVAFYDATMAVSHSGAGSSSVASGYSANSLKTRQLGQICRITRTHPGSTILRASLGVIHERAFAVGLCHIKIPVGATGTVTFKAYSGATLKYTSSAYDIPITPVFEPTSYVQHVIADLHPASGEVDTIEAWIDGDAPLSTMDVGRLWYGPAFQSARASGREWDTGPEDTGGVELSRGGQAYERIGVVSRTLTVPMPLLEEAEIYGDDYSGTRGTKSEVTLEAIASGAGKTGSLLVFQESTTNAMRPLYGHFQELPRFRKRAGIYYDTSLVFREER